MTLPCPDIAFAKESSGRLRTTRDGSPSRRQALKPGVGSAVEYAVEWTNLRGTAAQSIMDEFEASGSHASFSWTPPGGSAGRYKFAGPPSITPVSPNNYTARATLRLARGIYA